MADITNNINYNYKTNVQTLTRYHDRWDATMNRNVRTTQKLTRAIGSKDRYMLRSEKTTYRNTQAMDKGKKSANRFGQGMGGLALRFVGYQMVLNQVMGAQQKFIQFIKDSVGAFREFETRMAEVSTILGAEQIPLMARLTSGVENLSMVYGQATSDMAKGMYDILSAAFEAENALNLLTTSTRASIAGLSDIRTSVDIFTTVLNTYGMQVEQATNVSNTLFQSVIRGKFQFQDLEQALGYVVPIAAQAGIAFEELMAALSTATRHGLHLDMTSRGLALAIQGIVNPSTKATKAAEKYGIEMNGLALRVMGLHGWFEKLNEATQEYGKSILGELIPNMRSLRVAMVLAGDVGLAGFNQDLIELANMGNATEIALNKIMNTSQFVANQLSQQWEKVKRDVGDDWDEMMLNIQRGILSIGQWFTGADYVSKVGEKYTFIADDAIGNAMKYLKIATEIRDLEKEREGLPPDPVAGAGMPGITGMIQGVMRFAGILPKLKTPLANVDEDILELTKTQAQFLDSFNEIKGGILDNIDVLGDLELTLMNVELAITGLEDELTKTFVYGFKDASGAMKEASVAIADLTTLTQDQRSALSGLGNTIKGNLAYQYMSLYAQREYADATHDVSMGLKIQDYVYKEIPSNIQAAVNAVREHTDAQKKNSEATQRMTASMRTYQIQLLQIQLKGMMRRRGLTRMEERQIKKIQIAQAQARLENMQGQKNMLEADVSTHQTSKQLIDDYLLKIKEQQYELKYTYDQQITDLETSISREGEALQTRYDWWEITNQKIITSAKTMLTTLDELAEESEFVDLLAEDGIAIDDLREKIEGLLETAESVKGTYPTSIPILAPVTGSLAATEVVGRAFDTAEERLRAAGYTGRLPEYHEGIDYVPKTQPAMVQRGERIIPAGANSGSDIFQIEISVNAKVDTDYDVERLAAKLGEAIQTQLSDRRGKTKYRMR